MPDNVHVPPPGSLGDDDFHRAARRFIWAYYVLLSQDVEPALAAIVPWRNTMLDALNSVATIDGTANALRQLHQGEYEIAHLLVGEMDAFSALVSQWSASQQPSAPAPTTAASPTTTAEAARRSWWKRLLGIGRTAADSVKDILDKHLTPREKQIWKLCTEVLDIMKGA